MQDVKKLQKSKFKSKLVAFIFSQLSILLFGAFVGCAVIIALKVPKEGWSELTNLIKILGIVFGVLLIISLIISVMAYMIYKGKLDLSKVMSKKESEQKQPTSITHVKNTTINNGLIPTKPGQPKLVNKKITIQESSKKIVSPAKKPVGMQPRPIGVMPTTMKKPAPGPTKKIPAPQGTKVPVRKPVPPKKTI